VTGKVVDLGARLNTLRHSRSTYLTILSRANTIGETLSVQQRVDDIQSQIERLQGKLKVLRNQSADSTLTVAVSEPGTDDSTVVTPDQRTGINKAWHTSVSRFNHGVNAIVGALGPLLLALILIGLAFVIVKVAMRRSRRAA
jgi:hypothetical protein